MSTSEVIESVAQNARKLQEARKRTGILAMPLLMVLGTLPLPAIALYVKAGDIALCLASLPLFGAVVLAFRIANAAIKRGELFYFGSDRVITTAIHSLAQGTRESRLQEGDAPPARSFEQVKNEMRAITPESECDHEPEGRQ